MSIVRPKTLTPEEMDRLMERLANSGAQISMVDPRVTSAQTWILATIGASFVGLAGWGIKSINDLNQTMVKVVTQNEYRDRETASMKEEIVTLRADVAGMKEHIKAVDGRLVNIERKVR